MSKSGTFAILKTLLYIDFCYKIIAYDPGYRRFGITTT